MVATFFFFKCLRGRACPQIPHWKGETYFPARDIAENRRAGELRAATRSCFRLRAQHPERLRQPSSVFSLQPRSCNEGSLHPSAASLGEAAQAKLELIWGGFCSRCPAKRRLLAAPRETAPHILPPAKRMSLEMPLEENQRRAGLFQGVCQCIAFVLFFKSREKAEGGERHPGRHCGQGAPCSQPRGKPTTFPGTSAGSPEFLTLTLPHSSSSDVQQMNGSMKCRSVSERFSIRGGAG